MLVATWNVNSILVRMPNVMRWLDDVKPDVLCMQETKITDDKFPVLDFKARGYQCQLFGQPTYNGVAILTRDTCETRHRGYPGDDESAQSRLIPTNVKGINIVNVYIPNGQSVGSEKYAFKLAWMERLREFFDANYDPKTPVLLCGDFNVAPEERDVHDIRLWQGRIMLADRDAGRGRRLRRGGVATAFWCTIG